jgi:hypothetical protein
MDSRMRDRLLVDTHAAPLGRFYPPSRVAPPPAPSPSVASASPGGALSLQTLVASSERRAAAL